MLTTIDERKGLVKTCWENVRHRVSMVAPQFAKIVDSLSPGKSFPLFLAYYPYGDLKGDTISPFLPKTGGGNYRLNDKNIPKEVIDHLGYGSTSSPLGMLLEKKLEYYIDLKDIGITIPWQVLSPGAFFPLGRLLQNQSSRVYAPNGLLSAISGARSVFMLPKIGCLTNHILLQRDYNVQSSPPKSLYEHWNIFKQIVTSNADNQWRSCLIYFSKKWGDKIDNDKAWQPLRNFLLTQGWKNHEYERNHLYYNIAYSLIQNKRNLKPNPYLVDTARHLFTVALGAVPGYAPLCDNDLLPLEDIQKAFVESYKQEKYIPTIMGPSHFYLEESHHPVYYSLQYPSTLSFSPKSRKISSTIFEIRELKHIVDIFTEELSKENSLLADTIIHDIAKEAQFSFFHNNTDRHQLIQPSKKIIEHDNRFRSNFSYKAAMNSTFASDAPFLRGCVSIGLK
jgi:hypothetical protein